MDKMEKEFKVKGLVMTLSGSIVLLCNKQDESEFLRIRIGYFEARSINICIEEVELPRPLTYELISSILTKMNVEVKKVVVSDLVEGTFHAEIHTSHDGVVDKVDARPSDAINIALRTGSPIFVNDAVLEKYRKSLEDSKDEMQKHILENLDPEELPKM